MVIDGLASTITYGLYVDSTSSVDLRSWVDDLEALSQAIYFRLNTVSGYYPIYSLDYGVDFSDLFGEPSYYVIPEAERLIEEALLNDERILSVSEFSHVITKGLIELSFKVSTVYGDLSLSQEVNF